MLHVRFDVYIYMERRVPEITTYQFPNWRPTTVVYFYILTLPLINNIRMHGTLIIVSTMYMRSRVRGCRLHHNNISVLDSPIIFVILFDAALAIAQTCTDDEQCGVGPSEPSFF